MYSKGVVNKGILSLGRVMSWLNYRVNSLTDYFWNILTNEKFCGKHLFQK